VDEDVHRRDGPTIPREEQIEPLAWAWSVAHVQLRWQCPPRGIAGGAVVGLVRREVSYEVADAEGVHRGILPRY
jgi:hypothetical protein